MSCTIDETFSCHKEQRPFVVSGGGRSALDVARIARRVALGTIGRRGTSRWRKPKTQVDKLCCAIAPSRKQMELDAVLG